MRLTEYIEKRPDRRKAIADLCGVSTAAVGHWATGIRPVPAEWCRDIEANTQARVTRYELRPDVFGEVTAEAA